MANITEITIDKTVKESRQIMNDNFTNLNEGLSTAGSVKTVNNTQPDANGNIAVDMRNYLPLAGGTLTGALTLSGAPTADLQAVTKNYVDNKVASVVNSAPTTLDTLNELATALGNDANFATTVSTQLGNKLDSSEVVTTATANKVLRLNADAKLPVDITGNSATATKATQDGSGNVITSTYANKPVIVTTTWTASSTTLTVTNSAITATSLVALGVPTTITSTQYDALGNAEIICTAQSAGTVTLTALGTAPTVDIPIELTIVG